MPSLPGSTRLKPDRPAVGWTPRPVSAQPLSLVPKYHQVRADIERQIAAGTLAPGTLLPPERDLMRAYGVSRITLREALRPLLLQGTLVSVRGRGIMVAQPTIRQAGDVLVSFTDVLRSQGLEPGIGQVEITVEPAPPEVAAGLRLPPATPVARVARVRTAGGRPVNYSVSHLPASAVPGLEVARLAAVGSLYHLLRQDYGLEVARAEDEMWARGATRREAALLGIRARAPVLILRRLALLRNGEPIEHGISVIRSDIYRYGVRLAAPPVGGG